MIKLHEIIKNLQDVLEPRKEIIFAYLFGSVAEETSNRLSDVDVAVYVNKKSMPVSGTFGYKSELLAETENVIKQKVDIVVLNEAPLFLAYNILKQGKLILCHDENERVDFHFCVMRDYLDFQPFLFVQNEYLKERLKNGSFGGL